MPDTGPQPSRPVPAWYHIPLYALGGLLAAAGLVCMALQFAIPGVHGLSGAGAAFAVIGAVIVAAVAGQKKMDRIRRDLAAHHVVAEEVKQLTLVRLETYMQAIRAEHRDLYEKAMRAVDNCGGGVTARLDELRAEVEKLVAAALVEGLRVQEADVPGSAVVPFTRRN